METKAAAALLSARRPRCIRSWLNRRRRTRAGSWRASEELNRDSAATISGVAARKQAVKKAPPDAPLPTTAHPCVSSHWPSQYAPAANAHVMTKTNVDLASAKNRFDRLSYPCCTAGSLRATAAAAIRGVCIATNVSVSVAIRTVRSSTDIGCQRASATWRILRLALGFRVITMSDVPPRRKRSTRIMPMTLVLLPELPPNQSHW